MKCIVHSGECRGRGGVDKFVTLHLYLSLIQMTQYSTKECSAVQCSILKCSAIQCNGVESIPVKHVAVLCSLLYVVQYNLVALTLLNLENWIQM